MKPDHDTGKDAFHRVPNICPVLTLLTLLTLLTTRTPAQTSAAPNSMLAQTPTPQSLYDFIAVIALLASIIGNLAMALSVRKIQRREVSFGFIPAAKEEFDKHVAWDQKEHDNLFAKLGGMERGTAARQEAISKEWRGLVESKLSEITAANNEGRQRLWEKVTRVGEDVAALTADTETIKQRLNGFDAKLDRIIEGK